MSGQRHRKFSLGDIIRKLNEAGGPPQDYALRSERAGPAAASRPAPPRPAPPHAGPPARPPAQAEEEFDLFRYLAVLMRRRGTVALVTLLAGVYALTSYLMAERYYTASARLIFSPGYQNLVDDSRTTWDAWYDRENLFYTHLELIRSRAVLERLAQNIDQRVPAGAIAAGLTVQRGQTGGQPNDIIEVGFQHPRADVAAEVVNELCRTYADYRREVNAQERTRLIFKLEGQIDKVQAELTQKEDALRVFKERNRMVQLSDETSAAVGQLSGMEAALQQTELALTETRQRLESLRSQIGRQEANVVESMTYDNPFASRLQELEVQLNTLSADYSPEHFKVRTVRLQIDTLKRAMESDLQTRAARQTTFVKNPIRQSLLSQLVSLTIDKTALETRRAAQQQLTGRLEGQIAGLPAIEQQYAALQRESVLLEETLRMLKTQYETAKIQRDSEELDLRVFELAQTPGGRMSKVKLRSVLIGILVGLLLGIALAFLLEYLDQTVKTAADAEKLLEAPLLGMVPFIEAQAAQAEQPADLAATIIEPFRALRANLKHLLGQQHLQSLAVCSAIKGEGKTTLAANLGICFALDGWRVILVDCDMRRPQLHKLFGLKRVGGVSEHLQAGGEVEALLKSTPYPSLRIVTAGEQPHNPSELLGAQRFGQLLAQLRERADLVIVDSPALLPVSDTITIAPHLDACVLVVRALWTPGRAARQAVAQLRRIGAHMVGGIMNGMAHGKGYYPYYDYYGYYGYHSYDDAHPGRPHSLRELGLHLEQAMRERLQNLRFALPRLAQRAAGLSGSLARRRLFWVLLAGLLALAVLERRLRPSPDELPGAISLLSDAGRKADSAHPAIEVVPPLQAPAAPLVEDGRSAGPLRDSLERWAAALSRGDTAGVARFYDPVRLSWYEPGRLAEGETGLQRWLSQHATDSILVSSAWLAGLSASACTTQAELRLAGRGRPPQSAAVALVWRQLDGCWRIVEQRTGPGRGE